MEPFDTLVSAILQGEHPAGASLASERDLAERFGIGRPAVRETLRRLEALGIVESRHGSGTVVLDWKNTATLELLPYYVEAGAPGTDPERLMRELLRMRIFPTTEVIRLAATYAKPKDIDTAVALVAKAWALRADPVAFALGDLDVFRHLAASSNFPPAAWFLNSAVPAYRILVDRFSNLVGPPDDYRASLDGVLQLVKQRRADAAVKALTSYFKRHDASVFSRLGLEKAG